MTPTNGAPVPALSHAVAAPTEQPPEEPAQRRYWPFGHGRPKPPAAPALPPPDIAPEPVAPEPTPARPAALDTVDWNRWYPALIWFAAGVVAVTFALSYHGLYEFAREIVGLPRVLAILVPIGVDIFSLCCLAATFLTRDASWRVRLYCWLMFGFTVAVSVAGNAVYAAWFIRRSGLATALGGWRYLPVAAVIGASLWPAFSAGALHLLIVVRRHMGRVRDKARQAAVEVEQAEAAELVQRARAIVASATGATVSAILSDLGLDDSKRRTVERWTAEVRTALAQPKTTVPAKAATRRPINAKTASHSNEGATE